MLTLGDTLLLLNFTSNSIYNIFVNVKDGAKYWFLKDFDLFKKLGKMKLMKLSPEFKMQFIKKGEVFHLDSNNSKLVYFLKNGVIKIESNDNHHALHILKTGNIFGELGLFKDYDIEAAEIATVLEDGIVCHIEVEQMKKMLETYPALKNQLLKLQGMKIRRLQRKLEDLLYKDSPTRIKEYIFNYVNEFGESKDGVMKAKNILSHKDIAQLTNTSRQTVSNELSKLRKEKIIDYNAQEIIIKSYELNKTNRT